MTTFVELSGIILKLSNAESIAVVIVFTWQWHYRFQIRLIHQTERSKTRPVPGVFQSVLNIIHRTANPVSHCVFLTKMYRKGYLGKLGTHTKKQRGNPHPEYRTRTTDSDCSATPAIFRFRRFPPAPYQITGTESWLIGSILFYQEIFNGLFSLHMEIYESVKFCPHTEPTPILQII